MKGRNASAALTPALALGLLVAPAAADDEGRDSVTVSNLNILHGFNCDPPMPDDGDQCRVRDRIDLLLQHVVAADCPDVVTLQENVTEEVVQVAQGVLVGPVDDTVALIEERLPRLARKCDFPYHVVFDPEGATGPPAEVGRGIDEELILSRYPALDAEVRVLYSPLSPFFSRHVLFARIDHPAGPIDVFTTHLASGADLGGAFCGVPALPGPPLTPPSPPCPDGCAPGPVGGDTVRECQARQMAEFIEERHDVANPAFATGDFNTEPGSAAYEEFAGRGWVDSHLAAGNPECDPATGIGCSSGREDSALSDMESPERNQDRRIDFAFVVPARAGATCAGTLEAGEEDEAETGPFAAEPNPFVRRCGALPREICWPSDHGGNLVELACGERERHDDRERRKRRHRRHRRGDRDDD